MTEDATYGPAEI